MSSCASEDCVICFSPISTETGRSVFSCGHQFHYSCITRWMCSQLDEEVAESCPCCRKQVGDYEKIPNSLLATEFDADDENEDDINELMEEAIQNDIAIRIQAMWRGYRTRKHLSSFLQLFFHSIDLLKNQKAKHIQAIWRGYTTRRTISAALALISFLRT